MAAWICGDVLCFVSGITLIVTGIVMLKKWNKPLLFLTPKGQKVFSVLCIIIGVIGFAASLIMLLPILDILGENDGLNGFLGGFEKYLKVYDAVSHFTDQLIIPFFGFWCLCGYRVVLGERNTNGKKTQID